MEKLAGRSCPAQFNPADFAIHTIAEIPEEQLPAKGWMISMCLIVDVF